LASRLGRSSIFSEASSLYFLERTGMSPAVCDGGSLRWGILVYVLALRFVFLGSLNLFPEEAYYWNYAQHLDIGYLDHPPMVAWVIWIATSLAGNTEFAVRIGAFLSWFVALWFCFQLTRNL
jgi:4-amino-4-deoxy-L-arabinose transferase-like glycosyltransferase